MLAAVRPAAGRGMEALFERLLRSRAALALALGGLTAAVLACGGGSSGGGPANSRSEATPAPTATIAVPDDDRIRIEAIGVDAPLTALAVGSDGVMGNPASPDDVVVYDWSAWPGLGGSPGSGHLILYGRLDSGSVACKNGAEPPPCKAVFWDLRTLPIGSKVAVFWQKQAFVYTITAHCTYERANFRQSVLSSTIDASLSLLTDSGEFDQDRRGYPAQLMVRGVLDARGTAACPPGSTALSAPQAPLRQGGAPVPATRPEPASTPERPSPSGRTLLEANFDNSALAGFAGQIGPRTTPNGLSIDRRIENGVFVVQLVEGGPAAYFDGPYPILEPAFAVDVLLRAEGSLSKLAYGVALVNAEGNNVSARLRAGPRDVQASRTVTAMSSELLRRAVSGYAGDGPASTLRVEVRDREMKVFLDGELAGTLSDDVLATRPLRLNLAFWTNAAIVPGEDARAFFDNVRVAALGP